jgi:hypothetical protein
MADFRNLMCNDEERRNTLRDHPTLNGIDYIEVVTAPPGDNQRALQVHFITKKKAEHKTALSNMLDTIAAADSKVTIEGGVRIQNIKVTSVERKGNRLEVRVDKPGDFSTYTLKIDHAWHPSDGDPASSPPKLDPAYAQCNFSFKIDCPTRLDCKSDQDCPPRAYVEPLIDYMAKDYASFRQALLDLIPTLAPDWQDRHEADLGQALVELLAYTGDYLSYYQDAVANEAYLETARQRISVRRHARLIDYRMHDGVSARAFIHLQLAEDTSGTLPEGTRILTRISEPLQSQRPPHGPVFSTELAGAALTAANAVFETYEAALLDAKLNKIAIHSWGNQECCLPLGTTTVDLEGDLTTHLMPESFLLLEEVLGPKTGLAADADPEHRQIVRLTEVELTKDPLVNQDLTRVTWDLADALTFPLCLSIKKEDLTTTESISVARGNLVLADHGRTIAGEQHAGPQTPKHASMRRAHRIQLKEGPLSFRIPLSEDKVSSSPVQTLIKTNPQQAIPQVTKLKVSTTAPPDDWKPVVPHLLDSEVDDHHFTVETDNDGRALIRFGFGGFGMPPPDGSQITVTYRIGVGKEGNVGAESLAHAIKPAVAPGWPDIVAIRNPLPAWGGTEPESTTQVKRLSPAAFHAKQLRAVTEVDYARAAEEHAEVSKAVATFRWTGSWHTVFVTIDPKGYTDLSPALEKRVKDWITRYTLAGYDLEIDPPTFVPLQIEIDVCVAPGHFRAHVEKALLQALDNRIQPDGEQGFFHPDNFTFGQPLYLSQLYAAIKNVEGVDSAEVRRFVRQEEYDPEPKRPATRKNLDQGYVPAGRLEVIRLDNDPSLPENGVLRLNMMGGK